MTPEHGAGGLAAPAFANQTTARVTQALSIEDFYAACLGFGSGEVRRIRDLSADRSGQRILFIGERFEAGPAFASRPALFVLQDGHVQLLRDAPVACPRMSPDGRSIVFAVSGDQGDLLVGLATEGLTERWRCQLRGRVEHLAWSPSGTQVLAQVAGLGADQAGLNGGTMPDPAGDVGVAVSVSPSDSDDLWRRLWVVDDKGAARCLSAPDETVWEAAWCGNDAVIVVRSADHSEDSWYDADLAVIEIAGGREPIPYRARDRLGLPSASDDGRFVAFVDAVCSDRGLVCGTLCVFDRQTGILHNPDTHGVDVSSLAFRADGRIHYAGLRSYETVVGDVHPTGVPAELWRSTVETCGPWHPASLPIGDSAALVVREGTILPPEIALLGEQGARTLFSTIAEPVPLAAQVRRTPLSWTGANGTRIDGSFLAHRDADGPLPTIVEVHGGPVLADRPRWLGNIRTAWLVFNGYAVLHANPRGSCGRGREFAAAVIGDMGATMPATSSLASITRSRSAWSIPRASPSPGPAMAAICRPGWRRGATGSGRRSRSRRSRTGAASTARRRSAGSTRYSWPIPCFGKRGARLLRSPNRPFRHSFSPGCETAIRRPARHRSSTGHCATSEFRPS